MSYDNEGKGAGWIKDGKNGKYISANITYNGKKINFAIFKNTHKKAANQPDYNIIVSEKRVQKQETKKYDDDFEDDVPF